MTMTVGWLENPNRIILFHVSGEWSWDDMDKTRVRLFELLDSSEYPVFIIYDFTQAGRLPPNSFARLRSMNRSRHAAAGHTSMVGLDPVYRMVLDTFSKIYGRLINPLGLYLFDTVEDALQYIQETLDRKA